jgi:ubiquinone/menaquinone biosynthesis C-methylase UbiE
LRASFDNIAPWYDALSFIVYGNNLIRAKKQFIRLVPQSGRLLLMGGGTGNILNDLLENRKGLVIDFIDSSPRMLAIAEKNLDIKFQRQVNFICGTHHAIPPATGYDIITTFFVLDCMKQDDAFEFAATINSQLNKEGTWLFADFFYTKNIFQRLLLWFMYRFFRAVAGIPASELPDYDSIFETLNFCEKERKDFLNGFIRSKVYRKC